MRITIERIKMNITERKPMHPGKLLLEAVIKPLNLTITEAAKRLGTSRQNLTDLIHERISLTVDMAMRIAAATGTSPESWYDRQVIFDMWTASKEPPRDIIKFSGKKTA